ncbi:LOW QUALITY PROTEIN: phosphoenolpyruvate-dihydroxyacetone phosphotransferase [Geomicrobium sp. JCM 19038]|nr:LOW QUALITY PROTEIN: phosphoenolpyruvate-dihydroxyacetone phosphotransferase [Geomicrobium sp. JCM 19038]
MKKLMNNSTKIVSQFLDGLVAAHGNLVERLDGTEVIVRKEMTPNKVGLVVGSGHEPAHAGYVGAGMLDAAIAGEVFTSPGADQFLAAIQAADQGSGVLLIIKNYNGDVMNARWQWKWQKRKALKRQWVVVNDDIAVDDVENRRGIAGTVLVHKVAGAKAEQLASLQEVKDLAERAISNLRSMSVALQACTLPSASKPSFSLSETQMEVGIGIHGEQMSREDVLPSYEIAQLLVSHLEKEIDLTKPLYVLINGMGSTPLLEQYVFANDTLAILKKKDVHVEKTFVGDYMTSLDMAGISLTLFAIDDELLSLLQSNATTIQWTEVSQ